MKKKILAMIAAGLICVLATGCKTTYQEAINSTTKNSNGYCGDYFTVLVRWTAYSGSYRIVYANDTNVKYFIYTNGYHFGITPLYNADGTLQVYDGE